MGSFFHLSIAKIDGLCFGPAPLSSKTQVFASHVQPSRSFVASTRYRAMFFYFFLFFGTALYGFRFLKDLCDFTPQGS